MPALGLGSSVAVPGKPLGVDGGVNAESGEEKLEPEELRA